ncbi:MAG: molybdopterin-dependent oxidoreductase [Chloroflexi bacterium]|nr:molybdopterin-dependent oxidoreductase [Chloroflexota bacterium]MBU1752203.1 molybdopterin-dependent oxidoreductase [Chloroflexota bacterium]
MSKAIPVLFIVLLVSVLALQCPSAPVPTPVPTAVPEPTAAPAPATIAFKVTGQVDQEMAWSEDEVRAMKTAEAQYTNKQGEMSTYTGVPINDLLALAGVKSGATTLVFVADDGYTAEVALADVQKCDKCIVSFRSQGGFSTVLPDFPGNAQVKGVVEIQVK